ncbi:MAG: hypothetical protein CSA07_02840 [Bacteroidia bacterium]|nr:MAG: hypothetical protein CSA07_02840 [Bacteroidia bacterium]
MVLEKGRFPATTASYEKICERDMYYVDKTGMIWQLANSLDVAFLSRPRRFGKSMLLDTMACYFEGRRELFEGRELLPLEDAKGERAWVKHPVLRFDFSDIMYPTPDELEATIREHITWACRRYGISPPPQGERVRLTTVIRELAEMAGARVAVIIDEYDIPLLDALVKGDEAMLEGARDYLRSFYRSLKAAERHIHFLMVTGISQVRHVGLFSGFNHVEDISFHEEYSTICGFSEAEIRSTLWGPVQRMATANGRSAEQQMEALRHKYDGYRFSRKTEDVYNPFGLMNALMEGELKDYWSRVGTPSSADILIPRYDALGVVNLSGTIAAGESDLARFDYERSNPVPFLYQTGYLTIKGLNEQGDYLLDFPNLEVRESIMLLLAPKTLGVKEDMAYRGLQRNLVRALNGTDIGALEACIQAFLSSLPFDAEDDDAQQTWELRECRYRDAVHLVFAGVRSDVRVEQIGAEGISDVEIIGQRMVVLMELKMQRDGNTAQKALEQAERYAARHLGGEMPVWAVGAVIGKKARITWAERCVWSPEERE